MAIEKYQKMNALAILNKITQRKSEIKVQMRSKDITFMFVFEPKMFLKMKHLLSNFFNVDPVNNNPKSIAKMLKNVHNFKINP
ncbi:hypothetical protein [Lactovum miscens]|uniref:Uncharacterized protein n=1 Tax=Lactovum miscens TaxID=190387 RepID=A0A841C7W5_9LACT|nr:hypothetical protein [Lactovum miscens]MBB5887489.1 hypothetical protein [Lactovum miscens]